MKKLSIFLMAIVLLISSLAFNYTNAYAIDADLYKPAVYYPYLWKLGGLNLHDNPNCVNYHIFTSKQELQDYLYQTEGWDQSQASDAADFVFRIKNSTVAYVYTYIWYYNEYWNSFHDNYFMYREGPDTEAVVVGVSSLGAVTSFVTHPHYTLQKYDNPAIIDQTHPILYLRGAHHGPYQTSGIGNTFRYWGYNYNLLYYYPAIIEY
ncbi:MAG: hypothetical protein ACPLSA_00090 [Caldanaerobacter sp.]